MNLLQILRALAALWDKFLSAVKAAREKGRDETIQEAHREEDTRVETAKDIARDIDRMSPAERERLRNDKSIYRD